MSELLRMRRETRSFPGDMMLNVSLFTVRSLYLKPFIRWGGGITTLPEPWGHSAGFFCSSHFPHHHCSLIPLLHWFFLSHFFVCLRSGLKIKLHMWMMIFTGVKWFLFLYSLFHSFMVLALYYLFSFYLYFVCPWLLYVWYFCSVFTLCNFYSIKWFVFPSGLFYHFNSVADEQISLKSISLRNETNRLLEMFVFMYNKRTGEAAVWLILRFLTLTTWWRYLDVNVLGCSTEMNLLLPAQSELKKKNPLFT